MNNPHQDHPQRYNGDDEISLVDLTKILIRRWKMMVVIFLIIVLGALAYALFFMERTYDYVSLYRVAEQAPTSENERGSLEPPATVVAKVSNIYLSSVTRTMLEDMGKNSLPFQTTANSPEDTQLIRLSSQTSEENAPTVEDFHAHILDRISEDQEALLESRKKSLNRQLESARRSLETAKESSSESAGELVASFAERIATLEDRLAQLQPGVVVQEAVQSLKPTGTSRSLVMALAIALGGMLAVMAAFFSQFAVAVRESLQDDGE